MRRKAKRAITDRYVEGFLAGQTVAYCEAIKFGLRVAGQIACPSMYARTLLRLISSEGCRFVIQPIGSARISIWIYRDETVKRLITDLQSCPASVGTVWGMGKLFGYADREVVRYVQRSM